MIRTLEPHAMYAELSGDAQDDLKARINHQRAGLQDAVLCARGAVLCAWGAILCAQGPQNSLKYYWKNPVLLSSPLVPF